MTNHRTLLLSLRPRFAQAILSGTKTVELRRRPVNAQLQTPIILYASSPTMAIVGTARLREVQTLIPEAAWYEHHQALSLTRPEFDVNLLLLHRVCILNEPLSLRRLRQEGQFQPPQSFRYIAASDPAPLRSLIPAADRSMGEPGENARPETVRRPATANGISPASSPATTAPRGIRRHALALKIVDS